MNRSVSVVPARGFSDSYVGSLPDGLRLWQGRRSQGRCGREPVAAIGPREEVRACQDPGHYPDCGSFTGTAQAPLRIEGSPPQGLLPWHESDLHWATESAPECSVERSRPGPECASMFLSPGPVDHPCNRTMGAGRARPKRRIDPIRPRRGSHGRESSSDL